MQKDKIEFYFEKIAVTIDTIFIFLKIILLEKIKVNLKLNFLI
jgi:hypothetical protein